MNFGAIFGVAAVVLLTVAMFLLPDYAAPPIEAQATGYRGTGMNTVVEPRAEAQLVAANQIPAPPIPLVEAGPRAGDVYENVQVLGDLSQTQFTRFMLAITQWVSPQQQCTYCHVEGESLAADTLYTKRVSRWMIQMTRHINNEWESHVGDTGVTCYTCHRGNNLPQYVWWEPEVPGRPMGSNGLLGYYSQLYGPSEQAGLASLSQDPLGPYLDEEQRIRVVSTTALPTDNYASTKQTEQTYALMMHMSQSLGVNCTYCHNSRNFQQWGESPPARNVAWYGIRMVRDINVNYVEPTTPTLPAYRIGPHGDAPKANCTTCHQNVAKPLYGVSMLEDYPSLAMANVATRAELLPMTLEPMWKPEAEAAADQAPVEGLQDASAPAASEAVEAVVEDPIDPQPPAEPTAGEADAAPAAPAEPAEEAQRDASATPPADATPDGAASEASAPEAPVVTPSDEPAAASQDGNVTIVDTEEQPDVTVVPPAGTDAQPETSAAPANAASETAPADGSGAREPAQ